MLFLLTALIILSCAGVSAHADAVPRAEFDGILDLYSVNPDIPSYAEYMAAVEYGEQRISEESSPSYSAEGPAPDIIIDTGDVITEEDAAARFAFTVERAAFYKPSVEYYPTPGKNSSIERAVFIDGALPYKELALVSFPRIWRNSAELSADGFVWEKDNQGNDLRPSMVEAPEWIVSDLHDAEGTITEPLAVWLSAGGHTITFVSIREPMQMRRVTFTSAESAQIPLYNEATAQADAQGAADASGALVTIQAENAARTSSQMLYPTQELGSPAVTPYSSKTLINNTIGGNSWRLAGQWIEWEFDAPETGYYNISMNVNQNQKRGVFVPRKITIDGAVPFAELAGYGFTFTQNWKQVTLGSADGAYKIFLTQGSHTLRMEATLGEFAYLIGQVKDAIYDLNSIYRKIIQLTGVAPDKYRDYQIERTLPTLTAEMTAVRDTLTAVVDELRRVAGARSDRERVLITMRDQLNILINDNEKASVQIASFKINVRALGTWLNDAMIQPLALDEIYIHSPDVSLPTKTSFFGKIGFEVSRLFYSFIIDYNAIGNVADDARAITLWIGSGRDQANVVKALIDETFTKQTGISVNVMLVDMGTLLQATLAGQGPDAAIQVGWDLPMNYGLRGAVLDLTRFPDLREIKERFDESATTPYVYGESTYALPETQVFPMMFYRKDILAELGVALPETWADVNVTLAALSRSQMEIGMLPGEQVFATLLYQNGGAYYNDKATASALDSEEAIRAFKQYTEFYTDYKLDRITSVEERFRTGECPIIIADYTLYNNLQVSAPDIRGLWGMAPVPGTLNAGGQIDRSTGSYGGACVIMNDTDTPDEAWEFLKWWTSETTQVAFGREMESLMGSSARVPTANLEAFEMMPWPAADLSAITDQREWVRGIPQVPGGYFTYRNINNAFYSVTTPAADQVNAEAAMATPREALTDKVILINDEIRYKRTEFGLPLDQGNALDP
jgi:ABC-type glycerol-3-phosphate transport system substrate-binding protein